ncbi:hypothetical protein MEO40_25345 [Dolichospermum sp. ST_sed1]|nr:hypothetical protein [Dolichospermum sp. ST_sed1]
MNKKDSKRLAPTKETIRELFSKSGNECYFPECSERNYDENRNYVAQVVHISGVAEQRFNKDMTDEDRRDFKNLMIMCYKHHKKTDDVSVYTFEKMTEMKFEHESKFDKALDEFVDELQINLNKYTKILFKNLNRLDSQFNLNFVNDKDLLNQFTEGLNSLLERLEKVPPAERELFNLILKNSVTNPRKGEWEQNMRVLYQFIRSAIAETDFKLKMMLDVLESQQLISVDEEELVYYIFVLKSNHGWNYAAILQYFCSDLSIDLSDIIVKLDFSKLDS